MGVLWDWEQNRVAQVIGYASRALNKTEHK